MKRFAVAALATFGIVLAAVPAARADDTSCTGTPPPGTINGNLVVPGGASCTLFVVTVTGNVQVETNGTLNLSGSTIDGNVHVGMGAVLHTAEHFTIDGNIQADQCDYVELGVHPGSASSVGGNVQIQQCTALSGYNLFPPHGLVTISGNFQCQNNSAPCNASDGNVGGNVQVNDNSGGGSKVFGNTIQGNVQVDDNSGGTSVVGGNEIRGNLQCQGNTPSVTDSPFGTNTVAGHKQGQCAGL